MNKIKMLKSTHGVNDGEVYPRLFSEGETYEVGNDLLAAFVNMGVVDTAEESVTLESGDSVEIQNKVVDDLQTKPIRRQSKK